MSEPQRQPRALRVFVPAYLLVIGLGLVVSGIWLFLTAADEQFTAGLALVGGLTMLVAMAAQLSWSRNG